MAARIELQNKMHDNLSVKNKRSHIKHVSLGSTFKNTASKQLQSSLLPQNSGFSYLEAQGGPTNNTSHIESIES